MTFSDVEYGVRKRASRRETFLGMMDGTVPRQILTALTEPWYYPGERGRPPIGIEAMLRMYFLSIWYNLADGVLEEAIYDSYAMRKFVRLNFLEGNVPDATALPPPSGGARAAGGDTGGGKQTHGGEGDNDARRDSDRRGLHRGTRFGEEQREKPRP